MTDRFAREKEQILSQYILHHDVSEEQVVLLADRLDYTLGVAERLHDGQRRKTGEDYIYHPLRATMEVSRYGRIVDWASIEASLLHDTLEDTDYTYAELESEFPEAADLVMKGIKSAIVAKTVTYDLERQMEGATLVSCSQFGEEIIKHL